MIEAIKARQYETVLSTVGNLGGMMVELDAEALEKLRTWMFYRESDIAYGIEDFGELQDIFVALFGREAQENPARKEE